MKKVAAWFLALALSALMNGHWIASGYQYSLSVKTTSCALSKWLSMVVLFEVGSTTINLRNIKHEVNRVVKCSVTSDLGRPPRVRRRCSGAGSG